MEEMNDINLDVYKEKKDILTNTMGVKINNDSDSLTVGENGPTLITDTYLINKLAHFDRERIPERVVHAKGTGAFGTFKSYDNFEKYTIANFLNKKDKMTDVFVRFSTVVGSKGSADTARDPRGFAVKFFTKDGNYDIVGNNMPVFFIRDAIKFPDVIHSLKPSPVTNLIDPQRFWDFISLTPEATHMITWLYSDRGTIKDYTKMDGFGVNTYVWVNKNGDRKWIKYHFKTKQGIETLSRDEAIELAGKNPNISTENLRQDIEDGKKIEYELCVQIMDPKDAYMLDFDPLDDTKVWDEEKYPLMKIGVLTLNKNPENFFAQVEQSAFCPSNVIRGVEFSDDKMLTGRTFSYLDTQRYRLGINFMQLPINKPKVKVNSTTQDGAMTYDFNTSDTNYLPNSLNDNNPQLAAFKSPKGPMVKGEVGRTTISKTDDFTQAGQRYRSLSPDEQDALSSNIAIELYKCKKDIIRRVLSYFYRADVNFYRNVIKYMRSYVERS